MPEIGKDLSDEYYGIMKVVSEYDGRFIVVKGWSVTLSLAGLTLGFLENHYAIFALAAASAGAFWLIESMMKRHQIRYYRRMREIEVEAAELGAPGPRIDWSWTYSFRDVPGPVRPITAQQVQTLLRNAPWLPWVFLPHAVAVALGLALFVLALLGWAGLEQMTP